MNKVKEEEILFFLNLADYALSFREESIFLESNKMEKKAEFLYGENIIYLVSTGSSAYLERKKKVIEINNYVSMFYHDSSNHVNLLSNMFKVLGKNYVSVQSWNLGYSKGGASKVIPSQKICSNVMLEYSFLLVQSAEAIKVQEYLVFYDNVKILLEEFNEGYSYEFLSSRSPFVRSKLVAARKSLVRTDPRYSDMMRKIVDSNDEELKKDFDGLFHHSFRTSDRQGIPYTSEDVKVIEEVLEQIDPATQEALSPYFEDVEIVPEEVFDEMLDDLIDYGQEAIDSQRMSADITEVWIDHSDSNYVYTQMAERNYPEDYIYHVDKRGKSFPFESRCVDSRIWLTAKINAEVDRFTLTSSYRVGDYSTIRNWDEFSTVFDVDDKYDQYSRPLIYDSSLFCNYPIYVKDRIDRKFKIIVSQRNYQRKMVVFYSYLFKMTFRSKYKFLGNPLKYLKPRSRGSKFRVQDRACFYLDIHYRDIYAPELEEEFNFSSDDDSDSVDILYRATLGLVEDVIVSLYRRAPSIAELD